MLDKEFKYYLDNQDKLVKKHNGKHLVIMEDKVVGVFDSDKEAFFDSEAKYEAGTYLIQLCEPGDSSYTQSFHSRVSFV